METDVRVLKEIPSEKTARRLGQALYKADQKFSDALLAWEPFHLDMHECPSNVTRGTANATYRSEPFRYE